MGRLLAADFQAILQRHAAYRPQVYVETGTRYATQMLIAAPFFTTLHGIELHEYNYAKSVCALKDVSHAMMYHGDSRQVLPQIFAQIREPIMIVFDAHFVKQRPALPKTAFPLWEELGLLRERKYRDIALIDDTHTFGKTRPDMQPPGTIGWESVTVDSLLAFFAGRVLDSRLIGGGYCLWLTEGTHA
jgi:hypothetical protein